MGSMRLPGKVMMNIENHPLMYYVMNQIKKCEKVKILVATSTSKKDDLIENYIQKLNFKVFRGNENDVLDRYYQCAKNESEQIIVRISADSPLIDHKIIQECIDKFKKNNFDYLSNTIKKVNNVWIEHLNGFPKGFAVEVFRFSALERAWKESFESTDREHVTEYIWKHSEIFKLGNYENEIDYSNYRLVVDYPNDFKLIKEIIENFPENTIFSLNNIIKFLEKNPEMLKINHN
jgi:spore coat polysaccharide biosynthesis protein SpsF